MKKNSLNKLLLCFGTFSLITASSSVYADDLYKDDSNWPAFASDNRAVNIGDILTVFVYENAQSSNRVESRSSKSTNIGGTISAGSLNESGDLDISGGFTGRGEVSRREQLAASMSVKIVERYPNGDLIIEGNQILNVNGEQTNIGVRGRIRGIDITSNNTILSSKIADAKINYDGKGFVSRSAKPGILNKIFRFLGIG